MIPIRTGREDIVVAAEAMMVGIESTGIAGEGPGVREKTVCTTEDLTCHSYRTLYGLTGLFGLEGM